MWGAFPRRSTRFRSSIGTEVSHKAPLGYCGRSLVGDCVCFLGAHALDSINTDRTSTPRHTRIRGFQRISRQRERSAADEQPVCDGPDARVEFPEWTEFSPHQIVIVHI